MILLEINTTKLYQAAIWNDKAATTWNQVTIETWVDILDASNLSAIGILANTLEIRDRIEDQSTADFTIMDLNKAYHFTKSQQIKIYDENLNLIFGGFIDSVEEKLVGTDGMFYLEHNISCVDNHYLAFKRRMSKAFYNDTVTEAVHWILDNILVDENVIEGEITDTTITLQRIYNYVNVQEVLDELAEYLGYTWFISADKKLYFIPRTTYTSPFNINYESGSCEYIRADSLSVIDGNPEYRNIQYIRGGFEKTDLQTEYKVGDGTNQTWVVGYPIVEEPTIYLNDVEKTVGIRGVDTTEDFFWSKDDNTITQLAAGTKLTASDVLKIEYYGKYAITVKSADYEAIDAMKAIDGSSGIVEETLEDTAILSRVDGLAKANSLLDSYAVTGKIITWDSLVSGFESGQLIQITIPDHNLDHECLISEVSKKDEDGQLVFTVTAVSGPVEDFWTKYFIKLLSNNRKGESANTVTDVLQVLISLSKTWTTIALPNIFRSCLPGNDTFAGDLTFPCFEDGEELRYLELNISGDTYRRYRTQQTRTASQIVTTVIVPSADANAAWGEASLWGGNAASETIGSGIKLDTFSHTYTKNLLESLLFTITDDKWTGDYIKLLGYDNLSWNSSWVILGRKLYLKCTAVEGTLQHILVKCLKSGNMKFAVYSDNSNAPHTILATVGSHACIAGWNNLELNTEISLTEGQTYWIGFAFDTSSLHPCLTGYPSNNILGNYDDYANAFVNDPTTTLSYAYATALAGWGIT